MSEYELRLKEFSKLSKEGIIEKFRALIPFTLDASQNDFLDAVLMQSMKAPRSDWFSDILLCYSVSNAMISLMDKITDENPDLFLPRGEDSNEPITVRVFEDGDQQFLMKSEVFNTKSESEESFTLSAITMEKLLTNHESEIHNIEFIRYPITRANHRASPIQAPSGSFYVLAIDFFFDFLRGFIHGQRIFQKITPTDTPYFLKINLTLAADIDRIMSFPSKDVRDIQEDGFTIEDVKNELANLGLKWRFPEIQNYAEAVYSEVDKRKKGSVLRTCDLFDAVEHCQLNCILKIDDSLKKFVHSQKGCHRVYGFKCEDCAAEKSKKREEKLSILEKELNELKMSHQKTLEEVQELQQKNLRLSVRNETNEVKLKQLTEKLAQSKLSIDEGRYSTPCTSSASPLKIQCLICEKSIESGEDQIIRCPLCKRRSHSKCAINWLKEHQQCPACNGELPKY
ncbi:hypothetical protein B9Z55_004367 [Caenorhabditis nigoni]|uniref:RING-type domain-containing protein n=1 Tax=Caenorhabditis nigoni TaxID=1611254 RepID=A0A2G5UWX9_9PELO|nr:hypothetical protein B9Z55_004367 [Caenorhabditis nigoni]